jgi:hypothetical protein
MDLDCLGFKLLVGKPLEPFAEAFLAWSLATEIAGDYYSANDDAAWLIRLNVVDPSELEQALLKTVSSFLSSDPSVTAKQAAAALLRMVGTEATAEVANSLSPLQEVGHGWKRVENFCDTDPVDPNSAFPSNVRNAEELLGLISPEEVWTTYGTTVQDSNLGTVWKALARFKPHILVDKIRDIIATADHRRGMPLRQLSFRLDDVAALVRPEELRILLHVYERVLAGRAEITDDDFSFVLGSLLQGILPQLSATEQLSVLNRRPAQVPEWLNLLPILKAVPGDEFEKELMSAFSSGDTARLRRALFMSSTGLTPITGGAGELVLQAYSAEDNAVSGVAAETIYHSSDGALRRELLKRIDDKRIDIPNPEKFCQSRAFAEAAIENGRSDLFAEIGPRFRGSAVEVLGDSCLEKFADDIERMVKEQLAPIRVSPLRTAELVIDLVGDDFSRTFMRIDEVEKPSPDDMMSQLKALTQGQSITQWNERRAFLRGEAEAYLKALRDEGVTSVADAPRISGLDRIAKAWPGRFRSWLCLFLQETNAGSLFISRNLGLSLARAASFVDGELSAQLFHKLLPLRSVIAVRFGPAHLPLETAMLFAASDSPSINRLRRNVLCSATTDEELETIVIAAENAGKSAFLENEIDSLLDKKSPGMQARALTVAAFRDFNGYSATVLGVNRICGGFLANVVDNVREVYKRNLWARHWYNQLTDSQTEVDAWRYGELLLGCSDRRAIWWLHRPSPNAYLQQFGAELFDRIVKTADERSKKRKDTLFGLKRPSDELAQGLTRFLSN